MKEQVLAGKLEHEIAPDLRTLIEMAHANHNPRQIHRNSDLLAAIEKWLRVGGK